MIRRDYDNNDKNSGGTETHVAVDDQLKRTTEREGTSEEQDALEEGFASSSGVRPETAETGGRIKHPESKDAARPDPIPKSLEEENAGLAD